MDATAQLTLYAYNSSTTRPVPAEVRPSTLTLDPGQHGPLSRLSGLVTFAKASRCSVPIRDRLCEGPAHSKIAQYRGRSSPRRTGRQIRLGGAFPRSIFPSPASLIVTAQAQHLLAARTTNSELETSLKIARSNLALAEANTEALEETLKRTRAPLLTSAAFTGGQNGSTYLPSSTFKMVSPETAQQLWGDPLLPSPVAASPSDDGSARGGMSFWRRKKAITPSPTPPPPLLATFSRAPTPNLSDLPPLPSSPLDSGQRDSVDRSRLSVTSNGLEDERAFLHRKLDQLSSALAVERTATHQLRSAHHSLVNERDALNSAHADLQSELENLSQALFEEANKMVADERQRAAQLEEEVYDLRAQLDDLRQAAETGLERELGMTFDSAPSTARPHLPPSPLTSDASPEMMQVASPRRSSSRPSPPALAVVTTRNDYLTAPSRSPTLRSPTTSPSPSSSTLESPIEEQQEAPLPAGRQWLKSCVPSAGL